MFYTLLLNTDEQTIQQITGHDSKLVYNNYNNNNNDDDNDKGKSMDSFMLRPNWLVSSLQTFSL